MNSLKNATVSASIWNLGNVLTSQVRNFVVSWILARWFLEPSDFGVIGMAMAFGGLVDSFVDFGFGNSIVQKKEVNELQKSTVFYINLLMGVFLTIVFYFSSPLSAMYFKMPELENIVKVMSLSFVVKGLTTLQGALYKKELNYRTPFIISAVSGVISGAMGVFLAFKGYGVWSLIYSQVSGWVMVTILTWVLSSWRPSLLFKLDSVKELWTFGYKYSMSVFIDTIFIRLDTFVIGRFFSATTLGLFNRSKSLIRLIVQYSFSSFSNVLFPSFSKMNGDVKKMSTSLEKLLHIISFTTFLFTGLLVISSKELIVLVYTEKWIMASDIFKFLGLFTFIYTIPPVLNYPILALGKSNETLKAEVLKKALYLCAVFLGYYYGLYGYLSATVVAATIGIVFNQYLVQKYLDLSIVKQFMILIKYAIPSMVLILISYFLKQNYILSDFPSLVLYSVLYLFIYILYLISIKSVGYLELKKLVLGYLKNRG